MSTLGIILIHCLEDGIFSPKERKNELNKLDFQKNEIKSK